MKLFLALSLVGALGSSCLYVPRRGTYHPAAAVRAECPPAHHWDGYGCRHNGNGNGNGNGHRR